nr:hypothetical protein [Tanacetum cinerariifolium]
MKRKVGNKDRVVRQTRNSKYYESLETPPIKRTVVRPKKSVRANENKSSSVKRRGRPTKAMMKRKIKQLVLKVRSIKIVLKVKKSKISDDENNKNSKILTRTTPTTLFNAMAFLNDDRKKCLHKTGFGSMIGMGIYEHPGKLGYYVIDNFYTETNVLSLNDSSILVTLESVNDILGIPMGGCSIESLEPRTADDPFIKESKMESDSPASDDDNQKSDDDDGKQDVVLDEIDEQNKEDVCKEDVNEPIAEKINNEDQDAEETPFEFADRKDENDKQAEIQVETPFEFAQQKKKHVDTGDQIVEHNDANEDTRNTDSAFVDIRDEQNNDDSDHPNNADAKSEKEDEEFDALAITICNVCQRVPLHVLMPNE